ncbi:MAG: hypothetical protein ABI647_20290 [Gemmatimonadota bacterium]
MAKKENTPENAKGPVESQDLEVREVSAVAADAVKGGRVASHDITITKTVDKTTPR